MKISTSSLMIFPGILIIALNKNGPPMGWFLSVARIWNVGGFDLTDPSTVVVQRKLRLDAVYNSRVVLAF
jgi:hypothetical protein